MADSAGLAEAVFGTHLPANVVLLGAAYQRGALPLPLDALHRAIDRGHGGRDEPGGVRLGTLAGGRPRRGGRRRSGPREPAIRRRRSGTRRPAAPTAPANSWPSIRCPRSWATWSSAACAQLLDYQGPARARRWLDLVGRAAAVDDAGHEHALTRAVAEGWFKLLTYKDEYEVARLHLRLDLDRGRGPAGCATTCTRPCCGGWAWTTRSPSAAAAAGPCSGDWPVCGTCAARRSTSSATPATGGRSARWPSEYAGLVEAALAGLTPDGYAAAVDLARSVEEIRGYEDIKSASIARWRAAVAGG